jgi:UDP-glucose 4-epimerase
VTITALAELIKTITNSDSEVVYIPYNEAYAPGFEDMLRRVPNTDRIQALTGWQPEISLNELLVRMRDQLQAEGSTAS